jgi:hypothetical protein
VTDRQQVVILEEKKIKGGYSKWSMQWLVLRGSWDLRLDTLHIVD